MATYAQQLGARPATAAEKQSAGFKTSTRAYTLPDGQVLSHRAVQTEGLRNRYGEGIDRRAALEERARLRREELGIPSPRSVFDRTVHKVATTPVKKGGLGAKYDRRTRTFILPNGERAGFQQLARTEDFRETWQQWQDIRHSPGKKGQRQRFAFLKRYGFMEKMPNGKYRYIG